MMDLRIELLDNLERNLDTLLSHLDGGQETAAAEAINSAWTRCEISFERFRTLNDELETGAPRPDDVRTRMESVVRKQAVAQSLATRWKEGLLGELSRLRGARGRLEALRPQGAAGGSCDVRG